VKIEARVFLWTALSAWLFAATYAIWAHYWYGHIEWAGFAALILSGGLLGISGSFFWFVSRRIDPRPEDRNDAEIAEAAGELGFFSPGSYWPIGMAGAATFAGLGIAFPEITEMQSRAIFEAAVAVKNKGGDPHLEIMVPLIGSLEEMRNQAAIVRRVAADVFKEKGETVDYMVGTMIELPRAALTADQIAEEAEFFSFGTNDLTQTTFGISRDDINNFLPAYLKHGIFKQDPFSTLDQAGVGLLVKMATAKGRNTRADLKVGICGEHGGDPESVKFCHKIGLNYVSCSPFRLLTARLAAAQAAVEETTGTSHTNK